MKCKNRQKNAIFLFFYKFYFHKKNKAIFYNKINKNAVAAVWDIDCEHLEFFDHNDQKYLEEIVKMIALL